MLESRCTHQAKSLNPSDIQGTSTPQIYKGLHSQSSQRVLEELAEAFNSWYGNRKNDD